MTADRLRETGGILEASRIVLFLGGVYQSSFTHTTCGAETLGSGMLAAGFLASCSRLVPIRPKVMAIDVYTPSVTRRVSDIRHTLVGERVTASYLESTIAAVWIRFLRGSYTRYGNARIRLLGRVDKKSRAGVCTSYFTWGTMMYTLAAMNMVFVVGSNQSRLWTNYDE